MMTRRGPRKCPELLGLKEKVRVGICVFKNKNLNIYHIKFLLNIIMILVVVV